MELSTYFRINASETGQFERTLIVAEEGAYVSYLEGCTAPAYDENQARARSALARLPPPAVPVRGPVCGPSARAVRLTSWRPPPASPSPRTPPAAPQLHAAVVELSAAKDAEIKYSTVQNW